MGLETLGLKVISKDYQLVSTLWHTKALYVDNK